MLNDSGIADTDKAYIAGLFDGEGSIHFKRGIEKKKRHNACTSYLVMKLWTNQYFGIFITK